MSLCTSRDGKIDAEELFRLFQRLDHKASKVRDIFISYLSNSNPQGLTQFEVEDIIWEVDDDGDKCINWTEFQAMYRRCRNDRSGTLWLLEKLKTTTYFMTSIQDMSHAVCST